MPLFVPQIPRDCESNNVKGKQKQTFKNIINFNYSTSFIHNSISSSCTPKLNICALSSMLHVTMNSLPIISTWRPALRCERISLSVFLSKIWSTLKLWSAGTNSLSATIATRSFPCFAKAASAAVIYIIYEVEVANKFVKTTQHTLLGEITNISLKLKQLCLQHVMIQKFWIHTRNVLFWIMCCLSVMWLDLQSFTEKICQSTIN